METFGQKLLCFVDTFGISQILTWTILLNAMHDGGYSVERQPPKIERNTYMSIIKRTIMVYFLEDFNLVCISSIHSILINNFD